nr:hypothetical protein [Saprospiraceae bacterium]
MKLPSIPFLADAFLAVLRRFPFVMLAAAVGTVALMCLLEDGTTQGEKAYSKLVMACSLGLALTLCAKLVAEKWRLSPALGLLPSVAAIGLCVLYYFSLDWSEFDNARTPIRFIGLNLAAHLGVAFIPYLGAASVEDFWEYNKRLFGNFVVGAFYSLIIFTGLSIAILAVNELCNLSIDSM